MRNPISLSQIKEELATQRLEKTQKELSNLIRESVITDNKFEACKDAIAKLCNTCNLKSTHECSECYLFEVATENGLWKEL
jgi:hypothetical protein